MHCTSVCTNMYSFVIHRFTFNQRGTFSSILLEHVNVFPRVISKTEKKKNNKHVTHEVQNNFVNCASGHRYLAGVAVWVSVFTPSRPLHAGSEGHK